MTWFLDSMWEPPILNVSPSMTQEPSLRRSPNRLRGLIQDRTGTDFEPGPLWEAACRTIRTAVSQLEHREAVKGIAVSSLAESVVPIDSQGQFLAPAARPPSGGLGYLDCASTILGEPCEQTIFRREPSSDPRSKNLLRFRHAPPVTSRSFRHRLGRFRKSARHSNGMLNNSFTLVLIQMQRH
jgi:hypothetical protein